MKGSPRVDPVAIACIAAVVCFVGPVIHEGLGHGTAALVFGAPIRHITSVSMDADESQSSVFAVRVIAAAGIVSNLFFGVLGLRLFAVWKAANAETRYFLWLFGHSNVFIGSGYMLALSFADFGDIKDLVAGMPHPLLVKAALTGLGACVAFATYIDGSRTLEEFLGRENRVRRAAALTLISYFTIGILNTLAGALNPDSPMLILLSAGAASFGGNMPMAWTAFSEFRERSTTTDAPSTPKRSPAWVAAAVVSIVLLFAVLAPGVPR